jgi:3-hydroxybutyryl-CoA dehydrogenase
MDDGLPLVGVIGAGTMGAGIAQVAAVAGHRVLLADAVDGAAGRAIDRIRERVRAQVAKGRLAVDPDALDITATEISEMGGAGVVIEAVVEDLGVKWALFAELEQLVPADCLLASNSSSLTPTAMAAGLAHPERLVGLHFFNPVPVMALVEVISGPATAGWAADRAEALARAWGKTVVRSAATPGFIVNRIARPYYAEAWRLLEEHAAAPEVIDAVLTGAGGFRMGPFALMDLIGHDVNESVTRSVWASFGNDPRFAPSLAQRSLVEVGWLGRKTGRGCYDYSDGATPPVPASAAPQKAPAFVISHGDSGLGQLLTRSGVSVQQAGAEGQEGDSGVVELPGGPVLGRPMGPANRAGHPG